MSGGIQMAGFVFVTAGLHYAYGKYSVILKTP
jgi:hypothetical protein